MNKYKLNAFNHLWFILCELAVNKLHIYLPWVDSLLCSHLNSFITGFAHLSVHLSVTYGFLIWKKVQKRYNLVCVRDICKIFASVGGFSGIGHRMLPTEIFPERPSLPWQQNLGHNGLHRSLCKRYIEDLYVRWGVFEVICYGQRACAIIRKRTCAPPQKSYVRYMKNRYYLPTKTFLHFLTLL